MPLTPENQSSANFQIISGLVLLAVGGGVAVLTEAYTGVYTSTYDAIEARLTNTPYDAPELSKGAAAGGLFFGLIGAFGVVAGVFSVGRGIVWTATGNNGAVEKYNRNLALDNNR